VNMNRLRPKKGEDLAYFLSSVINDACRDVLELGMSQREIHDLLKIITESQHPLGRDGVKFDLRRACEELNKK
jgi:hypothetical protein